MWQVMIERTREEWRPVSVPTRQLREAARTYDVAVQRQPNRNFKIKWVEA